MIERRAFIGSLAVGALVAARPTDAQAKDLQRVGWLSSTSAASDLSNLEALRAGLRAVEYIEGWNVVIDARWADGRVEHLPRLAADLVRVPVNVLCTVGSPASGAAKHATSTIPIVFVNVAFPDRSGLVASYARPGGNLTGVAFIGAEYGKRLELLKEASPKLSRVAFIYNLDNPASVLALEETQRWAVTLGVKLEPHKFRGDNLDGVFGAITAKRPDALMTTADALIVSQRARIVEFSGKQRLLAMYPTGDFVDSGGLMFYGASIPEMYRHAAVYVSKVLKGAKPHDLPVEQPMKFDMVINVKVAKALGLTIPHSLLLRADRIIE